MTTERHIKLGQLTAIISFLLGTGIFGLYFLTSSFEVLSLGYSFIAWASLVNLVILISILLKANNDKYNRKKLFMTCGLMLLNIPIMLCYSWVTIILLDTMRITFTNATQTTLTNINIIGCGGGHIDKLESGKSETAWVKITGDCSINIEYLSNGKQKQESVAGYVTNSMGQKMEHNIGGQNEEQFWRI
ncbi:hypothetical protein AR687_09115 [Flavobacteriaceae bacterium CRH]|nr:hypothetical protein AR687_09115 [Flavobacteriaceae bacterium CRH]